jgi:hypothetical protein
MEAPNSPARVASRDKHHGVIWLAAAIVLVTAAIIFIAGSGAPAVLDVQGWKAWWSENPRNGVIAAGGLLLSVISIGIGIYQVFFDQTVTTAALEIKQQLLDADVGSTSRDAASFQAVELIPDKMVAERLYSQMRTFRDEFIGNQKRIGELSPGDDAVLQLGARNQEIIDLAMGIFHDYPWVFSQTSQDTVNAKRKKIDAMLQHPVVGNFEFAMSVVREREELFAQIFLGLQDRLRS